ncbi:MAG TPA: ABC transporter permease, partial [Sphingomicrobium sp.]|nr:ABC transporter permease [Sphingomicrobium sp.]
MWRNYWTVAVRALAKSKTYSIINIAGLAIGMAACILILLYIRYEQSYDSWVPDVENSYQFQTYGKNPDDGEEFNFRMASYVTKDRLKKDFPQIVAAAYLQDNEPVFLKDGQASATEDFMFTDDDFLKVVNLPLVAGTTLTAPQTAVITKSEAIKRFGTDQVIGQTLTVISRGEKRDFKINGVLEDLPKNSHMKINAIMRLDYVAFNANGPQFLTCWGCQSGWVYLKLKPGTDVKQLQAQLPAWEKRNIPDEDNAGIKFNQGEFQEWKFTNVSDIHLGEADDGEMTPSNDKRTITTFAIIAALILGMAVVNFTNLATARASQRAREVALRKVLGANRRQLIIQFVGESILISAAAMLLALALVELLVKPFAAFLEADLSLRYFGSEGILLPAIGLTLLVGIASGLYPAFFLSRF